MEGATLTVRDTPNGRELDWYWPEEVAERLTTGDRDFYVGDYNHVLFQNGTVSEVRLIFAISLAELIDTFGPPSAVFPRALLPFGNMALNLVYEEPSGYFDIRTRCSPSFSPNRTVYHYYWSSSLQTNPTDTSLPVIPWNGYATQFPDCGTVFQSQ